MDKLATMQMNSFSRLLMNDHQILCNQNRSGLIFNLPWHLISLFWNINYLHVLHNFHSKLCKKVYTEKICVQYWLFCFEYSLIVRDMCNKRSNQVELLSYFISEINQGVYYNSLNIRYEENLKKLSWRWNIFLY